MRIFLILIILLSMVPTTFAQAQSDTKPASKDNTAKGVMGADFGKLPTFIKSDSLSLQSENRTFAYSGNVEVAQGDMVLTADRMDGSYDENNRIKEITAKGKVLITKGPTVKASGEKAVYDATNATVVLSENPELQQEGSVLSADRIRVFLNDNRSVAEGTVRVKLIQKDKANISGGEALQGIR
jgi:lipopolysaccharide export system protein LptA